MEIKKIEMQFGKNWVSIKFNHPVKATFFRKILLLGGLSLRFNAQRYVAKDVNGEVIGIWDKELRKRTGVFRLF